MQLLSKFISGKIKIRIQKQDAISERAGEHKRGLLFPADTTAPVEVEGGAVQRITEKVFVAGDRTIIIVNIGIYFLQQFPDGILIGFAKNDGFHGISSFLDGAGGVPRPGVGGGVQVFRGWTWAKVKKDATLRNMDSWPP